MKRLFASLLIVCALSLTVIAGETGMPPCSADCGRSATTSNAADTLKKLAVDLILALIN
jgi:hypothetical protein